MSNYNQYELYKCNESLEYGVEKFTETYIRSITKYGPVTLFPKFREAIRNLETYRFNIIKKSRQIGASTLIKATAPIKLVTAIPSKPERILIINNKLDIGFELIEGIRRNLSLLPREFWGEDYIGSEENLKKNIFITNSKTELRLPNGSRVKIVGNSTRVKIVGNSRCSLKGFKPTWVIMDEAAYMYNGDELFGASISNLEMDGRFTIISTPNGFDKLFQKVYADALQGNNDFHITDITWYEVPKFSTDLAWIKDHEILFEEEFTTESMNEKINAGYVPTAPWYRNMCKMLNMDDKVIAQELDGQFL